MRKSLIVVLRLAALFAFTFTGLAGPAGQETTAIEFKGIIKQVDMSSNTLIVKMVETPQVAFSVDSTTKITINGKEGRLADLRPEQKVRVQADTSSGKVTAIDAVDS